MDVNLNNLQIDLTSILTSVDLNDDIENNNDDDDDDNNNNKSKKCSKLRLLE